MYQQPTTQHRRAPIPSLSQSELDARNALTSFVYEYLCHSGATKAAEAFKAEQGISDAACGSTSAKCFLLDWWIVFWDLYSATPDRKDKAESTVEARAFVEHFYGLNNAGGHPMPPFNPNAVAAMGLPPPGMDSTMLNYYRPPMPPNSGVSGASTQASPIAGYSTPYLGHAMGPRFAAMPRGMPPHGAFPPNANAAAAAAAAAGYDPRLMAAGRLPPNARAMPMSVMRPGGPMRAPGMYAAGAPFMEAPMAPGFQHSMMPNGTAMGGQPPITGMPEVSNPSHDPRYHQMMMSGMNPQMPSMNDPTGAGTPTSSAAAIGGGATAGGPSSVGSTHGNFASAPPADIAHSSAPAAAAGGPLSTLLSNGGGSIDASGGAGGVGSVASVGGMDTQHIKHSPASVSGAGGALNGGTPLQHGPGSHNNGPSSVQSQLTPHSHNSQSIPPHLASADGNNGGAGLHDYMAASTRGGATTAGGGGGGGGNAPGDEGNEVLRLEEISKIKSSLLDDYAH